LVDGQSELDISVFSHRRFAEAALQPEMNVI
jgi:hypothetical protein